MQLLRRPVSNALWLIKMLTAMISNLSLTPITYIIHTPTGHACGLVSVLILRLLKTLK